VLLLLAEGEEQGPVEEASKDEVVPEAQVPVAALQVSAQGKGAEAV